MIFGKIENLSEGMEEIAENISSKFSFSDLSVIPFSTMVKIGKVYNDILKLAKERMESNLDIDEEDCMVILEQHFGSQIRDIDFKSLNPVNLILLADILGVPEYHRERLLSKLKGDNK